MYAPVLISAGGALNFSYSRRFIYKQKLQAKTVTLSIQSFDSIAGTIQEYKNGWLKQGNSRLQFYQSRQAIDEFTKAHRPRIQKHQRITVRETEAFITTIARPTIKNRFAQLIELGLLKRKGKGRRVWYTMS